MDKKNWVTENIVVVAPVEYPGAVQYEDARSAAFYAMGIAVKENTPVTLVVPGRYLASTYTAITEAWFQKANVIVIAVYEKVSEVKTAWMDRCVVQTGTYGPDENEAFLQALEHAKGAYGPVLLNRVGAVPAEQPVDYSRILAVLSKVADGKEILAYYAQNCEDLPVRQILAEDKYGVLSRYIGMSAVKDVGILLCPARCVLLDANIFRNRYANANMKIILVDEEEKLKKLDFAQWISGNGWECRCEEKTSEEACSWLLEQTRQAVLIIS